VEPGTWNVEPGTWNLEPGTWNLEPGTWNLEPGTWNLEPGTSLRFVVNRGEFDQLELALAAGRDDGDLVAFLLVQDGAADG
jgi:hypothetical protein